MDSLILPSSSLCLLRTNCSTIVATSSVPTTQLITGLPGIAMNTTRSKKPNNKYQRDCSAAEQEESLFLPIEIIAEILCWLDARTLLRLKCVCKQWRALIEDPNFAEEHASRAPLAWHYKDEIDVTSQQVRVISNMNGLILESVVVGNNASKRKYRVRNPTMRRVFDVPYPHQHTKNLDICYVPSSNCYKLISVHPEKDKALTVGVDVLTLGSVDEPTWRSVDATLLRNLYKRYHYFHIQSFKGVVHFHPQSGLGSKDFEVVSLDMDKECFISIMVPKSLFSDFQTTIGYEDHRKHWYLSLAKIVKDELRLLVLEDYKKGKWAEEEITIPWTFFKENSNMKSAQPYWASPWYVWFKMNGAKKTYSIKSQQLIRGITYTRRPKGKKKSFIANETLVIFRGMRSEKNDDHSCCD